jgi:hypothetical protein
MTKVNMQQLLLAATVTLLATGSVARADFLLCYDSKQNPFDGESWRTICAGDAAAYADVEITPTEEEAGTISIHVTDHLDCGGDMHMECAYATSLDADYTCLTESDPFEIDYEGFISAAYVYCGCYSPGVDCHG